MKQLLTSAAMAMVLGTGAFAQTTEQTTTEPPAEAEGTTGAQATTSETSAVETQPVGEQAGTILADDLIGMRLYSTVGAEMAPVEGMVDPAEQGWEDIGEINDLVLTPEGNVSAVIVGVGGFLGIGEKDVALQLDQVNVYQNGEEDPVLVVSMTQEDLENAPAYEEGDDATMTGATAGAGATTSTEGEAQVETIEEESTTSAAGTETGTQTDTASGGATTETIQIQTPEQGAGAEPAAELETEVETEGAATESAEGEGTPLTEQANTAEVTEESQDATQMAQEDLTEDTDTVVEEDTAMEEPAAEADASDPATAETLETEPATTETEAASTETLESEPATTETVEAEAATTEPVESEPAATEGAVTGTLQPESEPVEGAEPVAPLAETDAEVVEAEETEMETETVVATPTRPAVEREGYAERAVTDLTVDDLTGANVYGIEDEDMGSIGDLVVSTDGTITDAIINFGGFLGLGQNAVAVSFDELQILTNEDGSDVRVYMDATREELEAMPEYQQ